MPFDDRKEQILNILRMKKSVTVKDLEQRLFVSAQTLRRDLMKLEEKGMIVRTHGGAQLRAQTAEQWLSFALRENDYNAAKTDMARRAANMVNDEDVIFLDATTSTYCIIPYLASHKDILVITNSAKSSCALGELGIPNICTGGRMVTKSFSYIGSDAVRAVMNYNANIMFFSCKGLSLDGRITSSSVEENDLRKVMMRRADKKVFLCNSAKIGKTYLSNLCTVGDVDEILCEKPLPREIRDLMKNK